MTGFLRALLSFVLLTALVLVLDGVVACFTEALGGGTKMRLFAALLTFLPLGLGAIHRGAGHVPTRARFLLLGFVGALPLMSGLAPISGILILAFLLPLRALGAQLHALLAGQRFSMGMGLIALLAAFALSTAFPMGLLLYLTAWALSAGLLRYLVPTEQPPAEPSGPSDALQAFLLGIGLTTFFFFFRPYFAVLDSGAAMTDLSRWLGFALVLGFTWATFATGFGESKLRLHALAVASLAMALTLPWWSQMLEAFFQPQSYTKLLASPMLREWVNSPNPILWEDHWAYGAVTAIAAFGFPTAFATVAFRCLHWPRALAPFLLGVSAALIAALLIGTVTLDILGTITAGFLFATALASAGLGHERPARASVQVAVVLVLGGLFFRAVPRPEAGFPLQDNFAWAVATEEESEGPTLLQEATFTALPRWIERSSGELLGRLFLADGRNLLQGTREQQEGRLRAAIFAATLGPEQLETIALVGSPAPATTQMLARLSGARMSVVSDPPELGEMAFRLSQQEDADRAIAKPEFVSSLTTADGPFDLIMLQGDAWWESRHSVLRSGLLRQAQLRLSDDGVCVFVCRPEQMEAGVLPAWLAAFAHVFPDMRLWLVPDSVQSLHLVIAGTLGDEDREWPPQGSLSPALEQACTQLMLPLGTYVDRQALEVPLVTDALPKGRSYLFRAPWHPVDRRLSDTAFHPESRDKEVRRAARVLEELLTVQAAETPSVLSYYAAEIAGQEFSVHDTYITDSPYAIEIDEAALQALLELAKANPEASSVVQLWQWVAVSLVELREVMWLETYMNELQQLGWEMPFVKLARAHAAMEMLDFEGALALIDEVLAVEPGHEAALQMRPYAAAEEQIPRDEHAGHDHR